MNDGIRRRNPVMKFPRSFCSLISWAPFLEAIPDLFGPFSSLTSRLLFLACHLAVVSTHFINIGAHFEACLEW
jgi:hypothetical protein